MDSALLREILVFHALCDNRPPCLCCGDPMDCDKSGCKGEAFSQGC